MLSESRSRSSITSGALASLVLCVAGCAAPGAAPGRELDEDWWAEQRLPSVELHFGRAAMRADRWSPTDEPTTIGTQVIYYDPPWRAQLVVGFNYISEGEPVATFSGPADQELRAAEFAIGVRVPLVKEQDNTVVPHIGFGLTSLQAELEFDGGELEPPRDEDQSLGGYASAGFALRLTPTLRIGVDARQVFGTDIDLFFDGGDADFSQITFFFSASY